MTFWVLIFALMLICSATLGLVLIRGRVGDAPPAAYDLQVYRDQLKEVERDLLRGVITEDEAERIRTEVSRRILTADAQMRETGGTGPAPGPLGKGIGVLALLGVMTGAGALYWQIGAVGYEDIPLNARLAASEEARQTRLSQTEAEALRRAAPPDLSQADPDFLELMAQLREAVASRPDDLQGHILLARNEAALGDLAAAHAAQTRVIELKGPSATANDYAELADMMVSAAAGYVSSDAEAAVRAALARDPSEPRARYYLGLYMIQVDRPDTAFRTWDTLLRESPADAPWSLLIRNQIEELAWRAGVTRYELPEAADPTDPRGPTQDDIDAAGQMTLEQRAAMIQGMVDGLAARIEETGGTLDEWARLSNAYAVLGDFDAVRDLLERARVRFPDPLDFEIVENGAKQAGFSE